jgi:molecular chaperone GrpE
LDQEESVSQNEASQAVEESMEPAAAIASEEVQPPEEKTEEPSIEELTRRLAEAERKAEGHRNELLRARAELDNVRKRAARDVESAHKYSLERFVNELLPVKDSLELGMAAATQSADIASLREGVELTLKMFAAALGKCGVQAVEPVGERFNPEFHQAMTMQESGEAEPGTVLTVVQKGYLLNDRLVRPALVIVAKAPPEATDP